jgi:hypothetical protein
MFTHEFIQSIIVLSITVTAVTQTFKKWFRLKNLSAVLLSAIVTIITVFLEVASQETFDLFRFLITVISVFLQANGFYHFTAYATRRKAES